MFEDVKMSEVISFLLGFWISVGICYGVYTREIDTLEKQVRYQKQVIELWKVRTKIIEQGDQ